MATEQTNGISTFSVTGITAAWTCSKALRIKSVLVNATAGDIIYFRENVAGTSADAVRIITMPQTTSGFEWDTGDKYVTPRLDWAASIIAGTVDLAFTIRDQIAAVP